MILITKASDDSYYRFTDTKDINKLVAKYKRVILERNDFYKGDISNIVNCCEVNKNIAEKISQCDIECMIYDDYIE